MPDQRTPGLRASPEALSQVYDWALLDLDGVIYRGTQAVDGVPALMRRLRDSEQRVAYVTNNASSPPEAVAERLRGIGVPAICQDVVTSAQAAADELTRRVPTEASVLVTGGAGLWDAVQQAGLTGVRRAGEAVGVVQGFDADIGWRDLAEAAYAVRQGHPWVVTNVDSTLPTDRGIAPGNGTLVAAVAEAAGRRPEAIAGKPYPALFDVTVRRTGAHRPLVVGDRLNTDIQGANRYGADSLLVMTGVTDLDALCTAPPALRPSYVSWSLNGLMRAHPLPTRTEDGWSLDGWLVEVTDGTVRVRRRGADDDAGLRAAASACWSWLDDHDTPAAGLETLWPDR